jgi:hypothetical protein
MYCRVSFAALFKVTLPGVKAAKCPEHQKTDRFWSYTVDQIQHLLKWK